MALETTARSLSRPAGLRIAGWLAAHRAGLVVLGFAVAATAINAVWLVQDRHGGAVGIDEAGYLALAVSDHVQLIHNGPLTLAHFVLQQPVQPPLVTVLSSLVFLVTGGPSVLGAFAVQLGAYAITIVLSFAIARRLAGTLPGIVTAIVVASTPIALDYTHEYLFAIPSSAAFTAAVWAALNSNGLTRLRWSLLWGIALGAMVLSRSLTLAFIPAFAFLALVQILQSADRRRALAGLGSGTAAAAFVAAPWYVSQGGSVVRYLTTYGYGTTSYLYGARTSPLSLASLSNFVEVNINEYLWLPLTIVLLIGGIAIVARAVTALSHRRFRELLASPWFYVGFVVVEGLVALESTRNSGLGFVAPVVPCLVALGVSGLLHQLSGRVAVAVAAAVIIVAAAPPWLGKMPLHEPTAAPVTVDVPGLGPVSVFDTLTAFDLAAAGEIDHRDPKGSGWSTAARVLVADVDKLAAPTSQAFRVIFAFNNQLLNVNTFRLDQLLATGVGVDVNLLAAPAARSTGSYGAQLHNLAGEGEAFVLIRDSAHGDFQPPPDPSAVAAAAHRIGFAKRDSLRLPDGSRVDVWQR